MYKRTKLMIWGREFELNIIYQNFPGESVISNQKQTVEKISTVDFSDAEDALIKYIKKYYKDDLDGDEITNIFKYVIPKNLLIPREEYKRIFALMCDYKFDMEHGLAIIFENEKYKAVGSQDIIL